MVISYGVVDFVLGAGGVAILGGDAEDCDLLIAHPSVGAKHLLVEDLGSGRVQLQDLNSEQGTWMPLPEDELDFVHVGTRVVEVPFDLYLGAVRVRFGASA